MRSISLAVAGCFLALFVAATGQTTVGRVTGTVRDAAGAPVAGVVIKIEARGAAPLTRTSDKDGQFTFERVPLADYDVTALFAGFRTFQTRITVASAAAIHLDIVLQPGGLAEQVAVSPEQAQRGAGGGRNGEAKFRTEAGMAGGIAKDALGPPFPSPLPIVERGDRLYPRTPSPDFNTEPTIASTTTRSAASRPNPLSTFSIDVDTRRTRTCGAS